MQCPKSIFNKFLAVCGGGTDSRECIEFAAEALGSNEAYYPDIILFHFDDISHEELKNWDAVETWIDDLQLGLDLFSVFPENQDDCFTRDVLPCDLVQNLAELKANVLRAIKSGYENPSQSELIFSNTVSCITIFCGTDRLELVFTDLDGWSLGHCDWVVVIGDLDDLSEADGYYQL